jgi:hypothetical protein
MPYDNFICDHCREEVRGLREVNTLRRRHNAQSLSV